MKIKTINIPIDFHPRPYGRFPADGKNCHLTSGEVFRKQYLVPALNENDKVHIELSGYNRYGRSFLDEAFGGLIRSEGFTREELLKKLTYSHDQVESIINVIDDRLLAASKIVEKR
jgi:hypothetical protein